MFPLLGAGAVAGVALIMALDRLPRRFLALRPFGALSTLSRDCRAVFLRPVVCAEVVGVSAAASALLGLSVYPLARSLGLDVSAFACVMLTLPVVLVTILAITIGGWGLREASFVFAFGFVGVPASSAVTLSVALGICNLLAALPGCVVWLADGSPAPRTGLTAADERRDGVMTVEAQV